MAIDRRNSFAAIPQLDAKLEKILNDNVIFEKKIINIQEFQSDFYSEYGQYKELTVGRFDAVTADIAYLKTFEADIKNLEADNATINGKLTAQEASIENLEADNATINGKLTAQEAEITNLSGEFASFVSGEFGTLSADVADIQTLMFGSATGTTITSEFANTVVSHVGEAQIHSGMIKELTFDKITGFDVNTTNLTIHSEDGKSQWYDNTIQISDANRVRVQIGKDASNDYSMYVWDAAGNLMFDALGLTDSGIQREIIRNDMVAEDAAINGSKLDIESVFREMDGSTYTLTSNHLTYDGKSLDLTLQSMSETDKEQGQLLSSQGTQITAIQGQIASKIWQQDIDTATGEMNTKYSELEQELDGFKTTVGETYSTKAEAEVLAEAARNAQKTAEDAQTDLDNAKANLADVTSRVDATEEDIAAAQKAVDDAQTAANNAQKAAVAAKSAADQAQSDVNALTKRVETAETSISQNTEQISLRATKTEVATAKNEAINTAASDATTKANQAKSDAISTASSDATTKANQALTESKSYTDAQIKVSADSIKSTVSSTYATKTENQAALSAAQAAQDDIDNLEVGGRNLITNSKNLKNFKNEGPTYISMIFTDTDVTVTGTRSILGIYYDISVEGASYYTLSFNVADISGNCRYSVGGNDVYIWTGLYNYTVLEEGRTEVTFKTNATTTIARIYFSCHSGSDSFRLWNVKLEKGNRATDWTPAPEDVDAATRAAADVANTAKTTAEQTADKFTWLVESGTSSSNFTLTDRVASLLSSEFQIDALTTFKNSAMDGTSTVINGGAIKANTISADKLNVSDLMAIGATIGGFRITSNSLITNNKIGLYSSGRIAVTGQSSYVTSDGSSLYSTLSCSGGTIVLDSNLSGTLDGLSGSNGRFHLDFKTIMGYGEGGASSDPLPAWFVVNNTNKQCTISAGGSLYVNDPEGNRLFGVLGSAGMIQAASLHCSDDIIFSNASRVGTDDAPSGRHTLANNTSVSFLNSSGTRVRGIALGNTDNILIGADADIAGMYGYITAQNNIVFYAGTSHDQCFASIYDSGKRYFQSKPIYDRTTSSGTAVRVDSNGTLYRYSSSSMRYKEEITCQLSEELNPERLYDLNVWQYKYREGHLDKGDQRYRKTHIGLLAEDVKHHYPIAANYNEDGDVEDWSERYLIPPMLKLIQMQHEEIEAIKAELKEIRAS